MKTFVRHYRLILDVVKIILKHGYNYNGLVRGFLALMRKKSTLAYTLEWFDSLYTDAGHTRIERKNKKIIITIDDEF